MKTAAAYIRVSTDDQVEYSPDSQLKAIRKYAKEHNMILPEEFIFVDEGISGRKAEKRPSFQRMIGTAKMHPKKFDIILLWKFSRFARNRQDSIVYKSMLRKQCGIDVISISEQLGEDNTSILIEALIEAMDEYYSLNLAEEVKRGMNEKFSRGGVVSQPPFGYKMMNGIFAPDEVNASVVQMMFNDYLSGMGTRQIASKLNYMGLRSSKGNPFENRTVEYILTNPTYLGKLRRSKIFDKSDRFRQSKENIVIVNGKHEPIISEDIFEKVQQKLSENKKLFKPYSRQTPVEFMLKGMVRCDNCGATLTMLSSHKYLQCHQYAKGACKVSHSISVKKLNEAVTEKIKSDLINMAFEINVEKERPRSSSPNITALIERENKKLLRVKEAYEAGVDTIEEYKENKTKILSKIAELEKMKDDANAMTFAENTESISGKVRSGLEILESTQTSETLKNITIRSFIDRIIFIKPKNIVEIFYTL